MGNYLYEYGCLKADVNADIKRVNFGNSQPTFTDKAIKCYLLLGEYINSAAFSPTAKNKAVMQMRDMDSAEVARRLGVSESAVRSKKSVAAKQMSEQLGDDVFEIIRSGNDEKIDILITKLRMLIGYKRPADWLQPSIMAWYNGGTYVDDRVYSLNECSKELRLLALLDKNLVAGYNTDKMGFLIYLLSGNSVQGCKYQRGIVLHNVFALQEQLRQWLRDGSLD
jgi:hypothetical protein